MKNNIYWNSACVCPGFVERVAASFCGLPVAALPKILWRLSAPFKPALWRPGLRSAGFSCSWVCFYFTRHKSQPAAARLGFGNCRRFYLKVWGGGIVENCRKKTLDSRRRHLPKPFRISSRAFYTAASRRSYTCFSISCSRCLSSSCFRVSSARRLLFSWLLASASLPFSW